MADMLEYLRWRGDIPFAAVGLNPVDALIFSELSYIQYDGLVTDRVQGTAPLGVVAKTILAMPKPLELCRTQKDIALLQAVAEAPRFNRVGICFYRNIFDPEKETQFAAVTFLPGDGSALLTFRGTDSSLVGWKEDFNMSYRQSIPAQLLAREYVREFAAAQELPMRLCGHSKGGNLAVYAGAKCEEWIQDRILDIYNQDGPGFARQMLEDPGYQRIVPKIRTFLPEFSVFGLMLERSEDYRVIRSDGVGILQHDPFSWQVLGGDFVAGKALTESSLFLDRTLTAWLDGLTNEERSRFFDALFDLLMLEDASRPRDVLRPQHILAALRSISLEGENRKLLSQLLQELLDTAINQHNLPV